MAKLLSAKESRESTKSKEKLFRERVDCDVSYLAACISDQSERGFFEFTSKLWDTNRDVAEAALFILKEAGYEAGIEVIHTDEGPRVRYKVSWA